MTHADDGQKTIGRIVNLISPCAYRFGAFKCELGQDSSGMDSYTVHGRE